MNDARQQFAPCKVIVVALAVALSADPLSAADIRRASAWPAGVPDVPIEERIAPATPPLVRYLRDDNRSAGIREVPRSAQPYADLADDIREAVATMPQAVHALVQDKLIGIYTARNLGSTAWTEHIEGPTGQWQRGIVVLDIQAVDKRGNTWSSWRESTAFKPASGFAIRARIAEDGRDGRVDAIRYILLHEFAHVASIGSSYLPVWTIESLPPEATCDYAFVCMSWSRYGEHQVSHFDSSFPERSRITYYRPTKARLEADRAEPLYAWLGTTDFVSAYAATSPHEDFAEAFANFVHTHMLGLPYRIDVLRNGTVAAGVGPCWDAPRCAGKRKFLERLLGLAGGG